MVKNFILTYKNIEIEDTVRSSSKAWSCQDFPLSECHNHCLNRKGTMRSIRKKDDLYYSLPTLSLHNRYKIGTIILFCIHFWFHYERKNCYYRIPLLHLYIYKLKHGSLQRDDFPRSRSYYPVSPSNRFFFCIYLTLVINEGNVHD